MKSGRAYRAECRRALQDGVIRANCFNNTYTPDIFMKSKNVSTETVLYVASSWKEANAELVKKVSRSACEGPLEL